MRLLQTLLFLPFFAATAFAQVPVRERPVLKALPLDFEETVPFVEEAIPPAVAPLKHRRLPRHPPLPQPQPQPQPPQSP